ncbi:TetR/AcrR family transcriptional regulator [Amycolatopsis sp. FDAARGOS 1241]|uniref:TetR/AcrR family transcriptional regulator n=1 Tax=Amycolatopsis sp. FDAARGOS 1241 TaxID=2778070 RepID=UPI00194F78C6|nr:TetR/AcrR family transcriptional regulator [Amycolatopsis sp. FDAARGOS 1241]QRP48055.1 TetR family transcriptional regulator [Amycolatopsis sp. FDAARGOS 1241]
MTAQSQARRRDAAATKVALLDAAEELFAERGFDRTTVRDIASRAGANQALLFRYFGSKEALFEAVMARGGFAQLEATPPERLFGETLRNLLEDSSERRDRSLETYLRSTGSDGAGAALREQLGQEYGRVLASLTDEPDAALRADLALAWLLGIGLVRAVTRKEPLASASAEDVVRLTEPAVRTLLERSE